MHIFFEMYYHTKFWRGANVNPTKEVHMDIMLVLLMKIKGT